MLFLCFSGSMEPLFMKWAAELVADPLTIPNWAAAKTARHVRPNLGKRDRLRGLYTKYRDVCAASGRCDRGDGSRFNSTLLRPWGCQGDDASGVSFSARATQCHA